MSISTHCIYITTGYLCYTVCVKNIHYYITKIILTITE